MSVMDDPEQLWRAFTRLTLQIGVGVAALLWLLGEPLTALGLMVGMLTLGGIVAFYARLARRFAQPGRSGFRRMLFLSGVIKYPILFLVIYLIVRGGLAMALGFALGVMVPLVVLTILALRMK
jgi:hypothetical protein